MTNEILNKLIQLSYIFKDGFTVEIKNGKINQYSNIKYPYIVSYKTIITINNDKSIKFNAYVQDDISNNVIIGGWCDNNNNYYIELNTVFKNKHDALIFAKGFNQKAIYNIKTQEVINVK